MMPTDARERELNSLLSECERQYSKLCQLLPSGIWSDNLPASEKDRAVVATAIHLLLMAGDAADRLLKAATLEGVPQPVDQQRQYRLYREQIQPNQALLRERFVKLIVGDPDIEIDWKADPPGPETAPIWNMLVSGLDYWKFDDSGTYSAEQLEATERFLYTPFFEPDQWMRNHALLQPIVGKAADRRIPSNVRIRMKELYHSFIVGNYLAAIALARAMLEYTVVDRAKGLNIDPHRIEPKWRDQTRSLKQLALEVTEKIPHLKQQLETIIENGNRSLHPKQHDRFVLSTDVLHELALNSITATGTVIENLYLTNE